MTGVYSGVTMLRRSLVPKGRDNGTEMNDGCRLHLAS